MEKSYVKSTIEGLKSTSSARVQETLLKIRSKIITNDAGVKLFILLILATSHFKLSVSLTGVFFISSLFTTGYVSWSNEHVPNSEDPFTQFDKIYDKPWTRLGPYLVGMATGWILFKTNLDIRMKRVCIGYFYMLY